MNTHAPHHRTGAISGPLIARISSILQLDQPDATELLLLRHAEPDVHAPGNGSPYWDPPLSDHGRWQAVRVALRLQPLDIAALYASPLKRARETAAFIAAEKDIPIATVDGLREVDFGRQAVEANGNGHDGAVAEALERFLNHPRWDELPDCEPSRAFRHRVIQAIEAIIARHPGQRVAIVSHGGVINAFLSMLLDIPRDLFFLPDHASISVVRYAGLMYAVRSLNDAAHLLPTFSPATEELFA